MSVARWRRLPGRRTPTIAALLTVAALTAALAGCAPAAPSAAIPPAAHIGATDDLYVSLGDSYAAGFAPAEAGGGATTRTGFAYVVRDRLARAGHPVTLVNLGCSGVTSDDVLHTRGCDPQALGPDNLRYPDRTQQQAAEAFLREHRGRIRLITVVVGGNDIQGCVRPPGETRLRADQPCLAAALGAVGTNLTALLTGLRTAVGDDVPIVGLTYPDVYLATALAGSRGDADLAGASVVLFRDRFNPVLERAYRAAGARFVDITAASGAYQPLTRTTVLPPYGEIPTPVADVCKLTYYCALDDVHPNAAGHALIADEVLRGLDPGAAADRPEGSP